MSNETHILFVQGVISTLLDFEHSLSDWDSLDTYEKAKTTTLNLYSLMDYLWKDVQHKNLSIVDLKAYRQELNKNCFIIDLVCDCANIYKHRAIKRPGALISRLEQIQHGIATVRLKDSEGYYFYNRKRVRVLLNSGATFDLADVLREVTVEFERLLLLEGIIPNTLVPAKGAAYFRPRKSCGRLIAYLDGFTGAPVSSQFQLVDYDLDTDSLIDSSFSDITFSLQTEVVVRAKDISKLSQSNLAK